MNLACRRVIADPASAAVRSAPLHDGCGSTMQWPVQVLQQL